jgi:hypothetical protein
MKILAIDPGSKKSGWVIVRTADNGTISEIVLKGKTNNRDLETMIIDDDIGVQMVVIESVSGGWGETVADTVFETAYAVGRFQVCAEGIEGGQWQLLHRAHVAKAYRVKKSDATIRRAVINRYAPTSTTDGKGNKAQPGFFYGMSADMWQAFALADAWCIRNPDRSRSIAA